MGKNSNGTASFDGPITIRECGKCNLIKPIYRFDTFKNRDGRTSRRGSCYECRREGKSQTSAESIEYRKAYNIKNRSKRERRAIERRSAIKEHTDKAKDVPCADCGGRFHPVAMDFDHLGDDKEYNISELMSGGYRLELVLLEIAKCEVVCACCHRIRTWVTRRVPGKSTKKNTWHRVDADPVKTDSQIVEDAVINHLDSDPHRSFGASDLIGSSNLSSVKISKMYNILLSLYAAGRISRSGRGRYQSANLTNSDKPCGD